MAATYKEIIQGAREMLAKADNIAPEQVDYPEICGALAYTIAEILRHADEIKRIGGYD